LRSTYFEGGIERNPKENFQIQVFRFHLRNRNIQSACQASFIANETIISSFFPGFLFTRVHPGNNP